MKPSLLIIGSSNVDFCMTVPRLPARGESVLEGTFFQNFGGKGANQAVASARASGLTTFVTAVGCDPNVGAMLAGFRQDGINLSHIMEWKDGPCGAALVMIEAGGMNYLTVASGANSQLNAAHLERHQTCFDGVGMVILQMEIPVDTNLAAIRMAKCRGIPVMLNYAPASLVDLRLLDGLDYLVVNEVEASALAQMQPTDPDFGARACSKLRELGAEKVILTLGEDGLSYATPDKAGNLPAFPVKAVDSTAAGDTFCGYLATALVEGQAVESALRLASGAAALSVTRVGAQSSIPSRSEVEAFLQP